MFVACSTLCFAREPLETALRHIAELEFDKFELALVEDGQYLRPSEAGESSIGIAVWGAILAKRTSVERVRNPAGPDPFLIITSGHVGLWDAGQSPAVCTIVAANLLGDDKSAAIVRCAFR